MFLRKITSLPRYREIFIKKEARIIIWKIDESEETLASQIRNKEHVSWVKSRKAESSRKQYLATRIILEQEGYDHVLTKDENGKPLLPDHHISITHDHNYVAVMIANQPCGIDLQSVSEKVLRVEHKFTHPEDTVTDPNALIGLTINWCIKEAIYKIHGDPMVYFKEHMRIISFDGHQANAQILHPDYLKDVTLEIRKVDELFLAYTI